jgi:glycosyltransferase involved in cell wall biosynthesis
VLHQSYRPIEIIIVDDGSSDQTAAVADELADTFPQLVHVIHQSNSGPGVARQRGLETAAGAFIQFLDSDDLLLPDKFKLQVTALEEQPDCDICYGRSYEEDHSFTPPRRRGPIRLTGRAIPHLFPDLLVSRWWTTSSPLYRKSLLDRIGPWRSWINEEDWEYDARAGATGAPLAWVAADVSIRRLNISSDNLSGGGCIDPRKLSHRARAQMEIHRCACEAGVSADSAEMKQFSRAAFLLSRQCALAGLATASRDLFRLARRASASGPRERLEFRLYGVLARLLGWRAAARLSGGLYRILHFRSAA